MRVSYKWLRELLEIPPELGAHEVGDKLTLVGLQVESLEEQGAAFKDMVVGKILERLKHPSADALSICSVDVGNGTPLQIVCGAPNCDAEKHVAVAKIGAVLPGGLQIAPREIRGVKSQGMLC